MKKLFFLFLSCFLLYGITVSAKEVNAQIPITCDAKNSDETFTYKISAAEEDSGKIEEQTIALKDGETGYFHISYETPGTYSYKVSQVRGQGQYTTYDDTIYQVLVYVLEDDNKNLSVSPVLYVNGSAEKAEACSFTNKVYIPKAEPENTNSNNMNYTNAVTSPVQTGDDTPIPLYITLLIISAGLLYISKFR